MRPQLGWSAVIALAVLGCGDTVEPLELAGRPSGIAITQGDQQRGVVGSALGSALAVTVTDSVGRPAPGVEVSWEASGGSLSQATDTTNDSGVASVGWTLPATSGTYTVRAFVPGAGDVLFSAIAQPVAGAITFRYLDAGGYHACGITTTEQVLCWGYNGDGQLGLGSTAFTPAPTLVPGDYRYRRVVGGFYHACAITLASEAWCWGNNGDDRLGDGSTATQSLVPTAVLTAQVFDTVVNDTVVPGQVRLLVQEMSAGEGHTCGINLSQHIWCWGRNREGQLGRATVSDFFPPSPLATTEVYKHVAVGGLHTCALTLAVNADAQCWGYNRSGQLGNGTNADAFVPVTVSGGTAWRTDPLVIFPSPDPDFPLPVGPFLAAGYDHTCGIARSGPTLCWGLNENGQLGDGSTTNRSSPAVVAGGHAFAAVTAGLRHSCALDGSGAAWCWGDNTHGELGDGTSASSSSPVAVAGGLTFAYLKAGELFTCGVSGEGVAYCWGDNEYGQLGDGSNRSSNRPVKVAFQP